MTETKRPAGYAPDLFSEHARLAQLGSEVLRILREAPALEGSDAEFRLGVRPDVARLVHKAATELGFHIPAEGNVGFKCAHCSRPIALFRGQWTDADDPTLIFCYDQDITHDGLRHAPRGDFR
jgi:hypothetical protein